MFVKQYRDFIEGCISNVRTSASEGAATAWGSPHKRSGDEEHKRAGGAKFVSPALQRGGKSFQKLVTESRRDGAKTLLMRERRAPNAKFSPFKEFVVNRCRLF